MAWPDNIREAAYTSPTGTRVTFSYEDVTFNVDKKTSGHTFPDANGTYVQDLGHNGRQYPFRAFLSGADYDEQAEALYDALIESGIGKLEHPIYGTVDVVPYGTITRRDDLVTAANQAVIEVTFWETINLVYPSAQADPASQVAEAVEEFNGTVELQGIDTAVGVAEFGAQMTKLLDIAKDPLGAIAGVEEKVKAQFDQIVDSLETNLLDPAFMRAVALADEATEKFNEIVDGVEQNILAPAILLKQTFLMLQSPARANSDDRQDVYEELMDDVVEEPTAATPTETPQLAATEYVPRELYAMGYMTGAIITLINTQYTNKVQAISAADRLLEQFGKLVTWRDNNYIGTDTGESYQKLQEAVTLTAGYLVEISFTLKQERRIVLDRARTIIDLSAELYGSVDDKLDFMISTNDLTGDEILELPRGREIVYYD